MEQFTDESEGKIFNPVIKRWLLLFASIFGVVGAIYYKYLLKNVASYSQKYSTKPYTHLEHAAELLRNESKAKSVKKKKGRKPNVAKGEPTSVIVSSRVTETLVLDSTDNVSDAKQTLQAPENLELDAKLNQSSLAPNSELNDLIYLSKLAQSGNHAVSKKVKTLATPKVSKKVPAAGKQTSQAEHTLDTSEDVEIAPSSIVTAEDAKPETLDRETVLELEDANTALKEKLKAVEEEKAQLFERLIVASAENGVTLKELELQCQDMEAKKGVVEAELKLKVADMRRFESSNRRLTDLLAHEQQETAHLRAQLEKAAVDGETRMSEMRSSFSATAAELEAARSREMELQSELASISKKASKHVEEALLVAKRSHADEVESIRLSLQKEYERQAQSLAKEKQGLEGNFVLMQEKLFKAQEAVKTESMRADKLTKEVKSLLVNQEAKDKQLVELKDMLRNSEEALKKAQQSNVDMVDKTVQSLRLQVENVEKTIQIAEADQQEKAQQLAEKDRALEELRLKVRDIADTRNSELAALEEAKACFAKERKELVESYEARIAELSERQKESVTDADELSSLKSTNEKLVELNKKLVRELALVKADKTAAKPPVPEPQRTDSAILSD